MPCVELGRIILPFYRDLTNSGTSTASRFQKLTELFVWVINRRSWTLCSDYEEDSGEDSAEDCWEDEYQTVN